MMRPLKQAKKPEKPTHPAGEVTGIDEATGLPIVRRDAAHSPDVPHGTSPVPSKYPENTPETVERPVVQGSTDAGEIRKSATEQEPALRAMVESVAAGVPGAKLEGSRVKAADSQANKADRGKPPESNIDNLGARLSAPSRIALEKLKARLKKTLPVTDQAKITANGLNVDQFAVQTGGKGEANQVSEVQVASPEQFAAMKTTEPLYEQQKAALARGDRGEAARLGKLIAAKHKGATDTAKPAEKSSDKPGHDGHKYKFGSTQANVPEQSEAGKALAETKGKIDPKDLAGDGLENEPHVTLRYGVQQDDTSGLAKFIASQKPFEVTLGKTESFKPSEHSDGAAPVIVPVESPELRRLEAEMDKHADFAERSFPTYKPHATLAYVKPEAAKKYEGMDTTEGKKFLVTAIAITDRDGGQQVVKLEGSGQRSVIGDKKGPALKAGNVVAFKDGRAGVVQFATGVKGLERFRVRLADGTVLRSARPADVEKVEVKQPDPDSGWIGVDLDGTLAKYDGFKGAEAIGAPVEAMVDHVKQLLSDGKDVRIFSARISKDPDGKAKAAIEAWCRQYLGQALPVTQVKDDKMVKLYDDRAVQVVENKGTMVGGDKAEHEAGDAHRQGKQEAGQ